MKYECIICRPHPCQLIVSHVGGINLFKLDGLRQMLSLFSYSFLDGRLGDTPSHAYNRAVQISKGKFVVLLDQATEITDPTTLSRMASALYGDVAAVGTKVIFSTDNTIYHAGITLRPKHRKNELWRGKEMVGLSYRFQGYPSRRQTPHQEDLLIGKALMMTTKKHWNAIGGFSEHYLSDEFQAPHFCLQAINSSFRIVYLDDIQALFHGISSAGKTLTSDANYFDSTWKSSYESFLINKYEVNDLTLHWNTPCDKKEIGTTIQSMLMVMSLESRIRINLEVTDEDECINQLQQIGFPLQTIHHLQNLMNLPTSVYEMSRALVMYRKPSTWDNRLFGSSSWNLEETRNALWTSKAFDYVIGMTSATSNALSEETKRLLLSEDIHQIWVPSNFSKRVFTSAGINQSKLEIAHFPFDKDGLSAQEPPLFQRSTSVFTFLSVFSWQSSDWKSLTSAFIQEFGHQEQPGVKMLFVSDMNENGYNAFHKFYSNLAKGSHKKTSTLGYVRPLKNVDVAYMGYYLSDFVEKNTTNLPEIRIIPRVPYLKMASLYRSADAFVRISFIEEWGQPFIEAMSMGLPCIGTAWSGNSEFMNNTNSILVNVTIEKGRGIVDLKDLRAQMRRLVDRNLKFQTSFPNLSLESVGDRLINILKKAKKQIGKIKKKKHSSSPITFRFPNFNPLLKKEQAPLNGMKKIKIL